MGTSSDSAKWDAGAPGLRDLYVARRLELVRLASLLLHDVGEAEEVVQEAFVAAYARWDRVRDADSAPAYLRSAVLNLARSRMRHRKVVARLAPPPPGAVAATDEVIEADDERRRMIGALRTLPARQCECLVLRYYLDLSEAEIAATLGISAGSVKTHTHRGLAALAGRLESGR